MAVEVAEIVDRESFEQWLEDRPNELAQILACRIALRVLPLGLIDFQKAVEKSELPQARQFAISIFRCNFISWAARRYPAHDMKAAATAATAATAAAAPTYAAATAAMGVDQRGYGGRD